MQKIKDAGSTPMRDQPGAGTGKSVTADALMKKYGDKAGLNLYYEIALAGGFGDLRGMASNARPPLDLTGLDLEHNAGHRAAVEALLSAADRTLKPKPAEE